MSTIENGIPVFPAEIEDALSAFWTDASDKGIYGSVRDIHGEAEVALRAAISRLITPPPEPILVGVADAAEFLCQRLEEFEQELLDDDVGREYYGHVHPAFARLVSALDVTNHGSKSDLHPEYVTNGGGE